MTIKTFSIEYDAINSKNIFTNGDTINGSIILEVSKETKVESLIFRGHGRANVRWSQRSGKRRHRVYRSKEEYYDIKHYILRKERQDEIIGQGRHVFPFSFRVPDRKMPSTFKTGIGKVVHKVKAELHQSMKLTKKAKCHFTFVSKTDMDTPGLMEPQYGSKDKSLTFFGSGNISADVHMTRMGYKQGEPIKVSVEINNQSSRSVKPKFILYQKKSYFAQGRRKVHTHDILKEKSEAVEPSRRETVTKVITLPGDLPPSILNCSIIKLEYRLKIQLDIKGTIDPVIKLPTVVMPSFEDPALKHQPPPAAYGFQGFGSPAQAAWGTMPHQQAAPHLLDPPPAYGAHALYPPIPNPGKYESKKY